MQIMKKIFSKSNLMVLAGLALLVFALWDYLRTDNQNISPVVLVNSGGGANLDDVNAFRPPLQVQVAPLDPDGTGLAPNSSQALVVPDAQTTGKTPDRLEIPSINLDAPILAEHYKEITLNDQVYIQWRVPFRRASGWHDTTALLGDAGNTVLNGHHNAYGEVFKDLVELKEGDLIKVYSEDSIFLYEVDVVLLLPEKYQSMEERINNASWIMPTTDERLTLVTCWPPESNTHRLIVVAFPVKDVPPSAQ